MSQRDRGQRAHRYVRNGEHALRRFRFRDSTERVLVYLAHSRGARQRVAQRGAARTVTESGRDDREFEVNTGCQQILHDPDAFHEEKPVFLPATAGFQRVDEPVIGPGQHGT